MCFRGKSLHVQPAVLNETRVFRQNSLGLTTTGTLWVGYLNEVQHLPRFRKSLDLQISSLVGSFKKTNALLVQFICSNETLHVKWCLHTSIRQTENGLKRVFVKHWLNSV